MKTFELLDFVFVHRGHDTVQRGSVVGVTAKISHVEKEEPTRSVSVIYDVRFPYPKPGPRDEDYSTPFDTVSTFDESMVYETLLEAFEQKRLN